VGFKKIMVAIDSSSLASVVYEQVLELAKIDVPEGTEVQEWLQNYHYKVKDQGISVEFGYRVGGPGLSICDLAQSLGRFNCSRSQKVQKPS
jgi:hypothetical protein